MRVDEAAYEERLDFVDRCLRRKQSVYAIARELVDKQDKHYLIREVLDRLSPDVEPRRIVELVRRHLISKDVETIRGRFRREVSPAAAEMALAEFIAQCDSVVGELFKAHQDAPESKDKVAALRAIHEVAKDRAAAMGVDLEPAVRTKEVENLPPGIIRITDLVKAAQNGEIAEYKMPQLTQVKEVANSQERIAAASSEE